MRNCELYPSALIPGKIITFSSHPREGRTWYHFLNFHIRKLGLKAHGHMAGEGCRLRRPEWGPEGNLAYGTFSRELL